MRFLIIAICLARSLTAEVSENEALALRRIADFWEEGEYQIAKNQIEEFLEEFTDSPYKSMLSSALGDLFLREKSYQTALNYYAQIQDPLLSEKVFLHRMQCLYHLEWHATLADECEAYLKKEETDPSKRLEATYLLAIALYSQALTPQKDPQVLTSLAERAKPYFEELSHSELSEEVAGAFAHLQCILKDYPAASEIYLDLAEKSDHPEQHLFQAALIQTKYDRKAAQQTFERLASQKEGELAKEAAYNLLVLSFEEGHYEEIISQKENFFAAVPLEKRGLTSLFVGQSYLHLKEYKEAAAELSTFLDSSIPQEQLHPALLVLVEAGYRSENLELLNGAIDRLEKNDPERPKALFCRALILKKQGKNGEAQKELLSLLDFTFAEKGEAWLELINGYFEEKQWQACRESALSFLKEFNATELVNPVWQLLLAASNELGDQRQFILDLEKRLETSPTPDWIFRLAKAYFELGEMEKTIELLTPFVESHANGQLLYAFALRDGRKDEENYCLWAEKALVSQATLLSITQQHVSLFNSYLKQNKLEPAADHLYAALLEGAEVHSANLFWLADHFYARYEKDPAVINDAFEILSRIPQTSLIEVEPFLLKLAKIHSHRGQAIVAQELLETLDAQYKADAEALWSHEKEVRHFLAELHLASGNLEKAKELFEAIASSELYHDRFSASAALQSVRMMRPFKDDLSFEKGVSRLKNLILQKKLEHEPIYLEAALDYIDLLSEKDPSKRPFFLQKIKASFESQEDLLAKDYHAAMEKFPEQAKLYRAYVNYLDGEILGQEKSLHTKDKELLLQIREEVSDGSPSFLQNR